MAQVHVGEIGGFAVAAIGFGPAGMVLQQLVDDQYLVDVGHRRLGQGLAHVGAVGGGEIHRRADLDAAHHVGAGQVAARQVDIFQIGAGHPRLAQIGAGQAAALHDRVGEIGLHRHGAGHLGA